MADSNKNTPFLSLWLLPEEHVLAELQPLVDAFAVQYSTFSFVPHITLSTCWHELDSATRVIDDLVDGGGLRGIYGRLSAPFLGDGSILHLTFGYDVQIVLESQAVLASANERLSQTLDIVIPEWWHMSLLYRLGGISGQESEQLIRKVAALEASRAEFCFQKMTMIEGAAPIACEDDVAAWSVVCIWDL